MDSVREPDTQCKDTFGGQVFPDACMNQQSDLCVHSARIRIPVMEWYSMQSAELGTAGKAHCMLAGQRTWMRHKSLET